MSNNNDLPTTSRRQVVGGVNNEAASRKLIKRERVSKKEKRKILGPRGEIEVDVNPGDTIVTTTSRDGTVEQNVERTSSNSSSTKSSKSSTAKSSNSSGLKSLKLLKRMVPSARKSSPDMSLHNQTIDLDLLRKSWEDFNINNLNYKKTPYSHWYSQYRNSLPGNELGFSDEDLVFLNDYINNENTIIPYYDINGNWLPDSNDKEANKKYDKYAARRNELNIALSKKPNQNDLYKVIWRSLSPYHTPERSAEDHKYINTLNAGTPDEIGSMNWEAATGSAGPNFSIEDFTPEYNRWTAGFDNIELRTPITLTTNGKTLTPGLTNIDDIIKQNPDMFKVQYDYAQLHNGAFDYAPVAFDSLKLNSTYRYGGIGDFMDTYGLSPQELYNKLEQYYSNK